MYPLYQYKSGFLYFAGHNLAKCLSDLITPSYAYDLNVLKYNITELEERLQSHQINNSLLCYALKANSHPKILKTIKSYNLGADVVSGGELKLAIKAGISPEKIIFAGVGKTQEEMEYALMLGRNGILAFNVESDDELACLSALGKCHLRKPRVSLRLNPQVKAKTHRHISTGNSIHKFGLSLLDIQTMLEQKTRWKHLSLVGLSTHIGSQLTEFKASQKAWSALTTLAGSLPHPLEFLDFGGGIGIHYQHQGFQTAPPFAQFSDALAHIHSKLLDPLQRPFHTTILEPGRSLIGPAGILIVKVIRIKESAGKTFVIVDGGMNDLLRPALYDAYHEIYPLKLRSGAKKLVDIVGPLCETSDAFARERELPPIHPGDFLIIADAGAYGKSMASTYNSRPLTREIFL